MNLLDALELGLVITENQFAFYLASDAEYSYFDIGALDETAMADSTNLFYQPITSQNLWSQTVKGVRFGSDDAYSVGQHTALIDSSQARIEMPQEYFHWFLSKMKSDYGMTYTSQDAVDVMLTSCTVSFDLPTLFFALGDYWYEVSLEDYVITTD